MNNILKIRLVLEQSPVSGKFIVSFDKQKYAEFSDFGVAHKCVERLKNEHKLMWSEVRNMVSEG